MPEKILIVDDETDISFLLAGLLKAKQHHAIYANSLAQGYEKLKSFIPTILFLDINLPDGSGLEAIRQFRALVPGIRIIMISAYDGVSERAKAEKEGANAFISKPFSPKDIYAAIDSVTPVNV